MIASFGASAGFKKDVFDVQVTRDPNAKPIVYEKPLRYGKLEEIHHIFRSDPKSPPSIISLVFVAAVVGTLPLLAGAVRCPLTLSHPPFPLTPNSLSLPAHLSFFHHRIALTYAWFSGRLVSYLLLVLTHPLSHPTPTVYI